MTRTDRTFAYPRARRSLYFAALAFTCAAPNAGCLDCAWRFANVRTSSRLTLTEPSSPDQEVLLTVSVLRIETGGLGTETVALIDYGDGQWGLDYEDASGSAEWDFLAPLSEQCQGAYNATWTFSLALPKKWPPEIAAAHPPMVFNLTRDELYSGVEVCLWDGWCPTVDISEH